MLASITFEFPPAFLLALPLGAGLVFAVWRQRKRGLPKNRIVALSALRVVALLLLVFLAARPVWVAKEPPATAARSVVVLLDQSESMSLEEHDATRFQQALNFLRQRLLPALKRSEERRVGKECRSRW